MSKDLDKYRDEVMTHLKYIKERVDTNHNHLLQVNGRVRKNEISISWIKGIGGTIATILLAILSWFKLGDFK